MLPFPAVDSGKYAKRSVDTLPPAVRDARGARRGSAPGPDARRLAVGQTAASRRHAAREISRAAPAKPRDVKPSGGSQGDGIVQDPRAREPNRPRISPPFDKRKGIQALHKQLGGDQWEISIVTFPMLPQPSVSAAKNSDAKLVATIRRASAAMR